MIAVGDTIIIKNDTKMSIISQSTYIKTTYMYKKQLPILTGHVGQNCLVFPVEKELSS